MLTEKLVMLIVEDVDINRMILKEIFGRDYQIIEAENGEVAFEILQKNEKIDIILLDVIMPVMNGIELLEKIKQDSRLRNIPVVINSQNGQQENEIRALELGADDFIMKPYNPRIIKRRVENLIQKYILERKAIVNELMDKSERLDSLIDTVPGGIGIFSLSEVVHLEYYNDGFCQMLGYTRDEMDEKICINAMELVKKEDRAPLFRKIRHAQTKGEDYIRYTTRMIRKDGAVVWISISAKKLNGNKREMVYHAVFTDFTEEKEAQLKSQHAMEEMRHRAECDMLTGIYNRETFISRSSEMIERYPEKEYIIAFWNIDNFKVINELYGKRSGDCILQELADYLRKFFHYTGVYGRLEADHFVTCTTRNYMQENMGNFELLLRGDVIGKGTEYPVKAHLGLYEVVESEVTIDIMCDRANLALQSVKDNYITRWAYYKENMTDNLLDEQEIVSAMENALEEHQFFINIQPIVNTKTKELISGEALVRWRLPSRGMIPPNIFINAFEKNGFISQLDYYVWEEVCKYLANNKKNGVANVPISVNLSRINFYNPDLCDLICNLTEKYEIEPGLLKLEITESAYTNDPKPLLTAMRKFQKIGFKVLMDDFGSGYSSLNMLKDVPVDILKIDMKFIEDIETSERACNILYNIIKMAKSLKMDVIAEGVENESQYELLKNMGCNCVQGYYYSRPIETDEFTTLLLNRKLVVEKKNLDGGEDNKTILIVEDIAINRLALKETLGGNYKILEAANGIEALILLRNHFNEINLVITDILMPEMDGFELITAIRASNLYQSIPVIVITAVGETENEIKALELGALDVLPKPFDATVLTKRVENLLHATENECIHAEIHALREHEFLRKQLRTIIDGKVAGIARIYLGMPDNAQVKKILMANASFVAHHPIANDLGNEGMSYKEFFGNLMEPDNVKLEKNLRRTLQKKDKFFQCIFKIEVGGRGVERILTSMEISYEKDGAYAIIVEQNMILQNVLRQTEGTEAVIWEILDKTDINIWKYDIEKNEIEKHVKQKYGRVKSQITRNAQQFVRNDKIFQNEDRDRVSEMFERLKRGERCIKEIFHVRKRSEISKGEIVEIYRWLQVTYTTIFDQNGCPKYAVGIAEDVTESIEENHKEWKPFKDKTLVTTGTIIFAEADLSVNRFITLEQNGLSELEKVKTLVYDDAIQEYVEEYANPEEIEYCKNFYSRKNLEKWYREGEREIKFDFRCNLTESGLYEWFHSEMQLFANDVNGHICTIWKVKNIQEEKVRLLRMKQMAEQDSLTLVLNRITFEKQIGELLRENRKEKNLSAFIMIDIDNFKGVNDTFGHEFGDLILKVVSGQIRSVFRKEDQVGRMGGDEFAVFLSRVSSKEVVIKKVKALCRKVKIPFANGDKIINISCSVGVAFSPENGTDFYSLYRNADNALYDVKRSGKDGYKVYEDKIILAEVDNTIYPKKEV